MDLAKHDPSSGVRGQALFWLAQKAGQRAIATLGQAVNDDPDREVRKRAVFAISQLPNDDSVPKLIELRGRTAIRKCASRRCSGWVSRATIGRSRSSSLCSRSSRRARSRGPPARC